MHNCQRQGPHNLIYILPFYIHPFVSFTLTHIRTHDKHSLTLTQIRTHDKHIPAARAVMSREPRLAY